ncbi:MAG: N-acetyltransferase [Candidatus Taylorbacteria bacterium]|nr:N-acetyltransferase [Candidatus Taylorbacteria bacterium]
MNTKIISAKEAVNLLIETHPSVLKDGWCPILFTGDRITCCDEASVVEIAGKIVALATIAPEGEMGEGHPTIVGLYTVREHRCKGYGKTVLVTAIKRCLERGFSQIHMDVLTPKAMKTIQSLSTELKAELSISDQTKFGGYILD